MEYGAWIICMHYVYYIKYCIGSKIKYLIWKKNSIETTVDLFRRKLPSVRQYKWAVKKKKRIHLPTTNRR